MDDFLVDILARLAALNRIESAWVPGMLNLEGWRVVYVSGGVVRHWVHPDKPPSRPSTKSDLDLADVATRGILIALVREVTGDPYCFAQRVDMGNDPEWWTIWTCPDRDRRPEPLASGPTEGRALFQTLRLLQARAETEK